VLKWYVMFVTQAQRTKQYLTKKEKYIIRKDISIKYLFDSKYKEELYAKILCLSKMRKIFLALFGA
jgi:hypothetical protein